MTLTIALPHGIGEVLSASCEIVVCRCSSLKPYDYGAVIIRRPT